MWNGITQMDDRTLAREWAEHFWRQSWKVSTCEPWSSYACYCPVGDRVQVPPEDEVPSPLPRDGGLTVPEIAAGFATAVGRLGAELRRIQDQCEIDLYEPTPDEVRFGLAAREHRLLQRAAEDFDLWSPQMAPCLARSIVETRIVIAWLLKRDDPELYRRFKDYGIGKRKLFKLQIESSSIATTSRATRGSRRSTNGSRPRSTSSVLRSSRTSTSAAPSRARACATWRSRPTSKTSTS
jgi:hypothetical protein